MEGPDFKQERESAAAVEDFGSGSTRSWTGRELLSESEGIGRGG
jgi:hypothetical protein